MQECNVIYDLVASGFQFTWWPVVGIAALGLGYAIFRIYRGLVPSSIQAWQLPVVGVLGYSAAVIVFAFYLPGKAFLQYRALLSEIQTGESKTVHGRVTGYVSYNPGEGTPKERFSVCDIAFAFDPNAIDPGFHQASALRNGMRVRVTYVDEIIVHIETCESDLPSSPTCN